jgi:hypothetical protein
MRELTAEETARVSGAGNDSSAQPGDGTTNSGFSMVSEERPKSKKRREGEDFREAPRDTNPLPIG